MGRRLTIGLSSGVALLGLVWMTFMLATTSGRPAQREELARARQQWNAQLLNDYRIVIQHQTRTGVCEQDLEVRDGQIHTVHRNQCNQPPNWTVSRLFDWVAQLEQPASICYPSTNQCTCRVSSIVRVSFDPQLGYPKHVRYDWGLRPYWENVQYWQSFLFDDDLTNCANRARGGGTVELSVVSLTLPP